MSQPLYAERRARFIARMRSEFSRAVAIVRAAPVYVRNNDVEHPYRQESDFLYLTGFDEPESVLVMSAETGESEVFVRPRDRERETWDGLRLGVERASDALGVHRARAVAEFEAALPQLLEGHETLLFSLGRDPGFDARLIERLRALRARGRSPKPYPAQIADFGLVAHEMRLRKDAHELDVMRRAGAITAEAHAEAMRRAEPGMFEFELQAVIESHFRRRGSERCAYESIVGSGPNATILHYRENRRQMSDGDLVLIDAGCELEGYASDVTRTFPVAGKFSKAQRAIYDVVLEAQKAAIDKTRAGETIDGIHEVAARCIASGLERLGLLSSGDKKEEKTDTYKKFYMHRTSHWLGLDVHDVGGYYARGEARELEPGMVLTIEPGIYIAEDCEDVAPEWRGIGVRIEDDVHVTSGAPEVLTSGVPTDPDAIETLCTGG